jgi:hypothetical protein
MPSPGMVRRVDFVRTDVLKERVASFFRVERNRELGTALSVTSTLFLPRGVFLP